MAGEVETLEVIGKLPSNWRIARFGDVLEGGTRNGIYKSKEFHGRGAKVVNMGELFANPRLRDVPMKRVELSDTEAQKSSLKVGDLLFARRSLTAEGAGKCIVVTEIKEPTTFESSIIRARPNPRSVDSLFLYYLFNSPYGAYVLLTIRRQVAVSGITGTDLVELPIPLPPLPTQHAIASVLGTLDDLIELNREINELLEEMARALFKSWFVDFDPVRAKLEGRPPAGMDAATAALFPDHFQDSELGQIPKGWEVGKVSDLATLGRVAVNPGRHPEEFFDHYSLPAFDDGRNPKTEIGSAIMSNKFLVERDSVLLSKLNPHIPRVWLPDLDAKKRSVCSTEFMVAAASGGVSREYLFALFTNPYFASIYGTLVSGTTGSHQRISPDSFIAMQVVVPPVPLIKAFTDLVRPMFDTTHSNLRESRDLATLRDTLLPKLLSGEVSLASTGKMSNCLEK